MQQLTTNPMQPIDYLALLAIFLMIAVLITAVYQSYVEALTYREAYELVDTTFAKVWDGDRSLELYAWTVTKAKLHGNANPYINEVISHRLREFHAKRSVRMNRYSSTRHQSPQLIIKKPNL